MVTSVHPDVLLDVLDSDLSNYLNRYQLERADAGDIYWPGQTVKQAAAISIRRSFVKKYLDDDSTRSAADSAALKKFLEINESCQSMVIEPQSLHHQYILGHMKQFIYDFWYTNADRTRSLEGHPFDSLDRGRMGPGASRGVKGYDFYTKLFSSSLTSSSQSLNILFRHYINRFPIWSEAERFRSSIYGLPSVVEGSRLAFVPKSTEISRTICVEPSLNMFFQLGLGSLLEDRIKSYIGVDLSDQPEHNRDLARIGSLTGRFSTIDLSSASDSISMPLLRELLPRSFLDRLESYRCEVTECPDGKSIRLGMVSTMGNGFTFPLQTLLFISAVHAVYKLSGLELVARGPDRNFGVFGDDIICLSETSSAVISTLRMLGFKTNMDKTFTEGLFRESCGYDYFYGHNIRGVYLKSLRHDISRYVAFNRLNVFSSNTGVYVPRTQRFLCSTVRFLPVPEWENDDAGFRLPIFMVDKRYYDRNGSYVYHRNVPSVTSLTFLEDGIRQPKSVKHTRHFNPDGAYLAFLAGYIRDGKVPLRMRETHYRRRRSVAPSWEMTDHDAAKAGVMTTRWRIACRINFG